MNKELNNSGFSLTEVLIAVGILAVGMVFVAGVFPAGIYLTTVATERTVAAVAADEAFAKVRIYGVDFASSKWPTPDPTVQCVDFNNVSSAAMAMAPCEFEYPSVEANEPNQYYWSALCRRTDMSNNSVQVTVFVSRKTGAGLKYPAPPSGSGTVDWPRPVKVGVSSGSSANELTITGNKTYINDGYTIVDDVTGRIYRVLERYKAPNDSTILLDGNWQGGSSVWVVPPPAGGGRCPCITVYQRIIGF